MSKWNGFSAEEYQIDELQQRLAAKDAEIADLKRQLAEQAELLRVSTRRGRTCNDGPIYGWFDDPGQTEPVYDPPHDAPCLFCGTAITPEDIRTISMMAMPESHPEHSYFYRVHRTCHSSASETKRSEIDDLVWSMINGKEQ